MAFSGSGSAVDSPRQAGCGCKRENRRGGHPQQGELGEGRCGISTALGAVRAHQWRQVIAGFWKALHLNSRYLAFIQWAMGAAVKFFLIKNFFFQIFINYSTS